MRNGLWMLGSVTALAGLLFAGCTSGFLNPAFANLLTGGVVPLTPGPESQFVLVRVINKTNATNVEFVVTAEREEQVDEGGSLVTQVTSETHNLITTPFGQSAEMGILFDCNPEIIRIGLGENLDQPNSDTGLFLGAETAGSAGFGVPAGIAALDARVGNFQCGDTVIFEAFSASGAVGSVTVRTALLDFQSQPSQYSGPDTFINARQFLEFQVLEES